MKRLISLLGCLLSLNIVVSAQGISAAEYFIDNDPGVGNGTSIAITPTFNDSISFATNIPTTGLSQGFHYLSIRVKDGNGMWGLYEARGFYTTANVPNKPGIAAAEYFIDTDPGVGNGQVANIGIAGDSVNFTTVFSTSALSQGFHFLSIRARDSNGIWGLFESRGFYVLNSPVNRDSIVAAEYFVDTDPGVGNAIAASIGTSGDSVSFAMSLPMTGIAEGLHYLCIRTKDAGGVWGLYEQRGFYITSYQATLNDSIVAAEYFIDTDPGIGNGGSLIVANPDTAISQVFACATPLSISVGQHFLFVRVKDSKGLWSLIEVDTFNVSSNPTPITGFRLFATKEDSRVRLSWETLTEINTKDFEIEKSKNGIDFEKIGILKAAGNSIERKQYQFFDEKPNPELNFYRIKQRNTDASFSFSNVVKILFALTESNITIYPNPASDKVYASLPFETDCYLQCYNAQGQLVYSKNYNKTSQVKLNISAFAKGVYYIRMTNGIALFNGQFIKE